MKRIRTVAATIAIFGCACAFAGTFAVDTPTTLKVGKDRGSKLSTFTGKIAVSGTFIARWELDPDEKPRIFMLFVPDEDSSARLPYDAERGRVREIWIDNNLSMLSRFLPSVAKRELLSKKATSAEVGATAILTQYSTAIDCDKRSYSGVIVSGHPLAPVKLAYGPHAQQSC
jgi:hypothetical protein